MMFRNVLSLSFFFSTSAARSPQGHLARSLLNVTDYLSNLGPNDATVNTPTGSIPPNSQIGGGGGGVSFLKSGRLICDVKAASTDGSKYVHMVVGNLPDADLLGNYAYVMRVDFDATGELDPTAKVFMDSWDGKLAGKLKPALEKIPDAASSREESMANQGKSHVMLGKAYTAPGLDTSRIIVTGGTSENDDVVQNGGIYFTHMNDAYNAILAEAGTPQGTASVRSLVTMPLGAAKSYNPKYVIDKDVLLFYTGNVMTHHLMQTTTPLNDIYVVMPDEPANILAMCKYCQYRSLTPIADLGNGLCVMARELAGGASTVCMLFALLAAAWW